MFSAVHAYMSPV